MRAVILSALFAGAAYATEAIYLANGQDVYDGCGYDVSTMAFYNDISQSQNGQNPDDVADVHGCGYQCWECQTDTGTFSSGTTFTVNIDGGAQNYAVGQYAGYGTNSYGTGFDCFRDNGRYLYSDRGGEYYSIYYCKEV